MQKPYITHTFMSLVEDITSVYGNVCRQGTGICRRQVSSILSIVLNVAKQVGYE